jgi:hypothetical protein
MSYTRRDNSGSVFKNERKRDGHQDPDYTGSALIENVEHYVDGWINTGQTGNKYLALKFRKRPASIKPKPAPAPLPEDDPNDEIPF